MIAVGLIGIVVAMVLFLVLVYKGCAPYWVAVVCAIIVALTNGMGIVEAITGPYLTGMVDLIYNMFSIIFLGAILGKVYSDTGAAASIAHVLTKTFVVKRQGKNQVAAAMIVLLVVAGLCTMGGIDGYVLTFTLFPICMVISELCDIPRRFIPGMFCLNCGFMVAPGSPQIYNVMANAAMKSQIESYAGQGAFGIVEQLSSVSSTSALVPGWIATAVVAICGCATLIHMINKAKANGEHFELGPVEKIVSEEREEPHFVLAVLPLLLVFVLYSVVGLDVFLALGSGVILALLLMSRYLPRVDTRGNRIRLIQSVVNTLNLGAYSYPNALITVITPAALAGVVTATAAFGALIGILGGMNIAPTVLLIIVVCVVVALTSSPPAALMVAIPMFLGATMGPLLATAANAAALTLPISANAIFRISVVAASTFETLPFNGLIILGLNLAKTSHKESYKPMFMMTVVYTMAATIICALLCLIPGLA